MNAKQRRAHLKELSAMFKSAIPSEFNAELVAELIDAGKDLKSKTLKIESLTAKVAELELRNTKLETAAIDISLKFNNEQHKVAELEDERDLAWSINPTKSESVLVKQLSVEQRKVKVLTELVETANSGVTGAHSVMWQRKANEALATVKEMK